MYLDVQVLFLVFHHIPNFKQNNILNGSCIIIICCIIIVCIIFIIITFIITIIFIIIIGMVIIIFTSTIFIIIIVFACNAKSFAVAFLAVLSFLLHLLSGWTK